MSGFPWRTALFLSLALNLVVISAVVGAVASGARLERPLQQAPAAGPAAVTPRAFMQALPPESRRIMRRALTGAAVDLREQRAAARAARLELYEASRAEPYDVERVRAAFAATRAADAAIISRLHDTVADALGRIDAEDRRVAVDAMAERASQRRVRRD